MPQMPHNNRMNSSSTLKTNSIWKDTIGYDPYAADNEEAGKATALSSEQAEGFMKLARLSNKDNAKRGACKKCGLVGHLSFQCHNTMGSASNATKGGASSAHNIGISSDDFSDDYDESSSSSEEERSKRKKRRREKEKKKKSSKKRKREEKKKKKSSKRRKSRS